MDCGGFSRLFAVVAPSQDFTVVLSCPSISCVRLRLISSRSMRTTVLNPSSAIPTLKRLYGRAATLPTDLSAAPLVHQLPARALVARWIASAAKFGDICQVARQALITSTCGLGLLDESSIEPWFSLARQVGAQLQWLTLEKTLTHGIH